MLMSPHYHTMDGNQWQYVSCEHSDQLSQIGPSHSHMFLMYKYFALYYIIYIFLYTETCACESSCQYWKEETQSYIFLFIYNFSNFNTILLSYSWNMYMIVNTYLQNLLFYCNNFYIFKFLWTIIQNSS